MPPDRPEPSRLRRQLAAELHELRSRTRLAMRPFADLVYPPAPGKRSASQRVQRVENGYLLPSLDEVGRWLDAAEATTDDRDRVMTTAHHAHAENTAWADLLASMGGQHLNELAAGDERSAGLNCSYQQFIVPGLLQTEAYARALLPHLLAAVDPDQHVAGLRDRQSILRRPERQFRFVLTPRALRWNPDPQQVTLIGEQQDRLREIDALDNVSVLLLPDEAPPMGGYSSFTLYEHRDRDQPPMVAIELDHGRITLLGDDVERYQSRFADLYAAATPIGEVQ